MDEKTLNELAEKIQGKLDKLVTDSKSMTEAAKAEIKAEITDMVSKYNKLNDDFLKLQESVDTISAESKRLKENAQLAKSLSVAINEKLQGEDFKQYIQMRKRSNKVTFDTNFEDVTTKEITVSTSTQGVVVPQYINMIAHEPDRKIHMRDIIASAPTSSNRIVLPVEATITDGTATTAEADDKGASQFTLDIQTFPVQKIAAALKISEEMLDDIPGLTSYIVSRWTNKLRNKEDYELLYNTASSTEFGGLTTLAQAYVDVLGDSKVNYYDILRAAIYQAKTDEYRPNYVVLHPGDVLKLALLKDTTGQPLSYAAPWNPNVMTVHGIPILETTAMGEGEFLVGDFANGCQIFDKMSANVRFYDQDEDNAQKNLITVVIEERLALVTIRAAAFVYGTFAAAMAKGSA